MVDYTPYLRLAKPPFDEIPWDEAVNGNMDILDAFTAQYMSVPNFTGAWANSTDYVAGQNALDVSDGLIYTCLITHTSGASPLTFTQARFNFPLTWSQVIPAPPPVSQAYSNTGRNRLHNPLFNIGQRGPGPFTTNGYTVDRWSLGTNLDTTSVTLQLATDTDRQEIGDELPTFFLQLDVAGDGGAASQTRLSQPIESLRRLAGKTVTLSFWATCSVAASIGVNAVRYYGTGGVTSGNSPALDVGNKVDIDTTWRRYSTTFAMPSEIGASFGTNLDSFHYLQLWFSAGSSNNIEAGDIGVQNGVFKLWGVQLEVGFAATQLEVADAERNLANCKRFFATQQVWVPGAASEYAFIPYPTSMAMAPTITGGGVGFVELNPTLYGTNIKQTVAAIAFLGFSAEPPL